MSSTLLSNLENSLHFSGLARLSSLEKSYGRSWGFLKLALKYNPDSPYLLYEFGYVLYCLKNYMEAIFCIRKSLELLFRLPSETLNEILKFKALGLILEILESFKENHEIVKENLVYLRNNANFEALSSSESIILEELDAKIHEISIKALIPHASLNLRKIQAEAVFNMLKSSDDLSTCHKNNASLYLLSSKWFSKWKKYCYFHHLTHDHSDKTNEMDDKNDQIIDDLTSDEEEEGQNKDEKHVYPGFIDQSEILQEDSDLLFDPDEVYGYSNEILKKDAKENKDFIIVSERIWNYLSGFYQGKDIKRFAINANDKDYFVVEIFLKKIKFVVWPHAYSFSKILFNNLKTESIYISKKSSVKLLKERIQRILNYMPQYKNLLENQEIRIWKGFDSENYEKQQYVFDEKAKILMNSTLLKDENILEDIELNDEDTLLVEIKVFPNWIFEEKESHTTNSLVEKIICSNCKSSKNKLFRCGCFEVYYCDEVCQKEDWKNHKEACKKAKEQQQKSKIMCEDSIIQVKTKDPEKIFNKSSRKGLAGLQNIGNTCFMNSGLQCLSNAYVLTKYFLTGEYAHEINEKNVLGTGGKLARSYANLLEEIWVDDKNYASTWEIKKIIAKLAPQFYGYHQQDSQEFLSYLLDGLHEDLNRVKVKPIVENKDYELCDDEIVSKESWDNYLKRNQSIIVDHFAGQFKSTIVCPDCNRISVTFDPFLIASLPIPSLDYTPLLIYLFFYESKKTPLKLKLNLFSFINVDTLLKRIGNFYKIDDQHLEMCRIKNFVIREFIPRNTLIIKLRDIEGVLFVYEKFAPSPQLIYEPEHFANVEIQILQKFAKKKENFTKEVGFSRLYEISLNISLIQFHLEIYKTLRENIKNMYKLLAKWQVSQYFAKHNFETEERQKNFDPLNNLEAEYREIFLSEKKELLPPYNIFMLKGKNEANLTTELIPFDNATLKSILKGVPPNQHIKFQIVFDGYVKVEDIKLTVCFPDNDHKNINDTIKKSFTIQECFELFTREEKLDKENEWYCNKCKGHKQATKKMELYKLPDVLILHLKRFKTSRIGSFGSIYFPAGSTKINSFVEFPIEEINLDEFCKKKNQNCKYQLIGVSNHYGEMGGGHYTAYCRNHFTNKWYEFDDASVSTAKQDEVVSQAAYMLFYQKIN